MARTTIRTEDITASEVTTAKMATDPTNATNLASGTVATARMGSGSASSSTFLRGDGTWDTAGVSTLAALTDATVSASDPSETTNPSAVGHLWINSTSGEQYICTDATTNNNIWTNVGDGTGDIPTYMAATGGTITTDGDYKFHTFTGDGTFTVTSAGVGSGLLPDILVVAGGGGTASRSPGGGGAGGLVWQTSRSLPAIAYSIGVGGGGSGGAGGGNNAGTVGADSTFGSLLTAKGGGQGKHSGGTVDGGSGGGTSGETSGDAGDETQTGQAGDSGTYGFGNDGGYNSEAGDPSFGSGGGGGSGAAGANGTAASGGDGGAGKDLSSALGTTYGESGWFAGGGGGGTGSAAGTNNTAASTGGQGGGAAGDPSIGSGYINTTGNPGQVNTGGGSGGGAGGGGGGSHVAGGAGGSGIVIIKYKYQ